MYSRFIPSIGIVRLNDDTRISFWDYSFHDGLMEIQKSSSINTTFNDAKKTYPKVLIPMTSIKFIRLREESEEDQKVPEIVTRNNNTVNEDANTNTEFIEPENPSEENEVTNNVPTELDGNRLVSDIIKEAQDEKPEPVVKKETETKIIQCEQQCHIACDPELIYEKARQQRVREELDRQAQAIKENAKRQFRNATECLNEYKEEIKKYGKPYKAHKHYGDVYERERADAMDKLRMVEEYENAKDEVCLVYGPFKNPYERNTSMTIIGGVQEYIDEYNAKYGIFGDYSFWSDEDFKRIKKEVAEFEELEKNKSN